MPVRINIHVAMHMIERSSLETYNEVKTSVSRNQIRENMKHMHRQDSRTSAGLNVLDDVQCAPRAT